MKRKNKSKSGLRNANVTDFLVAIIIITVVAYIGVVLYFYYKHSIEAPAEITDFITKIFGVELMAMATIQISSNVSRAIEKKDKGDKEDARW